MEKMKADEKMPDGAILDRFSRAVREMVADDALAKAAPQEFSITPYLAMKMVPHFDGLWVSAEWTSREDKLKKVRFQDDFGKWDTMQVRPDIIVHTPHTEEDNILVVEAKRVGGSKDYEKDLKKLSLLTLQKSPDPDYHYGYRLGVHLIIDLPNRKIAGNDVYRDGQVDPKLTELLTKMLS